MMKWGGAGLLFLALLSSEVTAQNPGSLKFHHLTQQHGLSQSTGQAIFQDSQGFMWFGTSNGLNKYTGYDFTIYQHQPSDSTTISGNNISYIYEDLRNNLWIGTTGSGLNLYDRDKNNFKHYKINYSNPAKGLSDNSITSILELSNGKFWIGTDNGLNYFDPEKEEFVHFFSNPANPKSLSSSSVNHLYEDKRGNFWVATSDGLNLWDHDTGTFSRFLYDSSDPYSISGNDVTHIYEDSDGNLWLGTTEGLNRYNRDEDKFYTYIHDRNDPESISGNSIFSILEDSRGVLWIGTENNGLNVFDREKEIFLHYTQNLDDPGSLNNNAIYTIYENNDNILWIGTYSGGINYVDRKEPKFEHYKYNKNVENTLSTNSITSFLEDSRGNMWVGTDGGGLNRYDRNTGEFYPLKHNPDNENSLSSDVVLALLEGSDGKIWIGYYRGGLSSFDVEQNTFTHYKNIKNDNFSLCHNDVFALLEDEDKTIWVGTNGGGVCKLNPENGLFTRYDVVEGVVRDLFIDSRNNFWIATYGGGLKLLDRRNSGIWNFYEGDNGLFSNVVLTIHEDKSNNFWIGTKEAGLNHFDRDSLLFTSYNDLDGLPSNEVKGILEDDHGNLWLSTTNGLSKFNPEDKSFFNYTLEDGLQANEFNTLAYYKDSEGYMYFGGINGFNRFHPDSVKTNPATYPVVFTDFKIFNNPVQAGEDRPLKKHISQADEIILPHTATVLTFEYAALNYNEIKGLRYAYKLEGFEDEWNYVGNKRSTTYTNLKPGEYILKVKSSNTDNIWSDEEASIAITITPPFWLTTWFYIIAALVIGASIFGIYRVRVKQIKRQNKKLTSKVSERTSELHQKNKDLEKALKDLKETRSELVENAHKAGMADIATGVVHNIGNVLNSISTSTTITGEVLNKSKFEGLFKANEMLLDNAGNLEKFLTHDPKGKRLLEYYQKLNDSLKDELKTLKQHNERMEQKVQLINNIITAQQNYASVGNSEKADLEKVLDDALTIFSASIDRHKIQVEKYIEKTVPVTVQKTKLVHVLLNIFNNAKDAMIENRAIDKKIIVKIYQQEDDVFLEVSDTGTGIESEHLNKIFTHGFTTKKNGHGFGLHSSANYLVEMGGKIRASSHGKDKGATFILSFPTKTVNKAGKEKKLLNEKTEAEI